MKRIVAATPFLALLFVTSACVRPSKPPTAQPERAPAPLKTEAEFTAVLDQLLPGMGAEKLVEREKPQQEFEQMCFEAGRPGVEAERAALCRAIVARLAPDTAKPARLWLLRQLERISGEESVATLAELLKDPDAQIREHIRKVLQNNPAPEAAAALRDALSGEINADWQVALINALAARRDRTSLKLILPLVRSQNQAVAAAAIAALADLGGPEAVSTLDAIWHGKDEELRELGAAALLRVADQLLARGDKEGATRIFRGMYGSTGAPKLRVAGLRGLVAAQQAAALPTLLELIRTEGDPQMQRIAARLAGGIQGQSITRALVAAMGGAPPGAQTLLLEVLGARGDVAAKPAVLAALPSSDAEVRAAALRALEKLGGAHEVVVLAAAAAKATGAEHDAARHSLARLRDKDVDAAIVAAIKRGKDAAVRAELIRSLADRYCKSALPTLCETAQDTSMVVRQVAFESLGKLAAEPDLPKLVNLLVAEANGEVRAAAENALVTVALTTEDRERRAAPALAALPGTQGPPRSSLIRVLGRLQGSGALTAVRAALTDNDEDVADAAVRAISAWEDIAALDDLLPIARDSPKEAQRVLALRGYVRLLRLPSERPAEKSLELLKGALALATRDEEKKLVLSALGDLVHIEALSLVKSYLGEVALRDEAASATVTIAIGLAGENRPVAQSAIEEVLTAPLSEAVRKRAEEAREQIKRLAGFIMRWRYAGPYSQEGMAYDAVFAHAFPPELPDAPGVTWQTVAPNNKDKPWIFDLAKIKPGDNCCLYVQTTIWSDAEQDGRLEIGSDDGVQVWLNGQVVHSNPALRGLNPGEDKIKITLKHGANPLRLKIVQANGEWSFCCGILSADGNPIEGLRFTTE